MENILLMVEIVFPIARATVPSFVSLFMFFLSDQMILGSSLSCFVYRSSSPIHRFLVSHVAKLVHYNSWSAGCGTK